MNRITLERANSFGKVGRPCKDLSDTGIINSYVAIKDIPRARAAYFVDLTKGNEVGFTDMLQNLSQDIDWDRRHDDGYGASLCAWRGSNIVSEVRMLKTCQTVPENLDMCFHDCSYSRVFWERGDMTANDTTVR
jgi:hypothetical protein